MGPGRGKKSDRMEPLWPWRWALCRPCEWEWDRVGDMWEGTRGCKHRSCVWEEWPGKEGGKCLGVVGLSRGALLFCSVISFFGRVRRVWEIDSIQKQDCFPDQRSEWNNHRLLAEGEEGGTYLAGCSPKWERRVWNWYLRERQEKPWLKKRSQMLWRLSR